MIKKIMVLAVISTLSAHAMAASGGDGVATPVCGIDVNNTACGGNAQAVGGMATAIGWGADAAGAGTAYGFWSTAAGSATAVGGNAMAAGVASIAIGAETIATGMSSIMVGNWGAARGQDSIALGTFATTNGTGSVAIGAGSTDGARSNVVSVGDVGAERQIVNVAAGTATTDAVNLGQLNAVETIARNADSKATTALTTANSASSQVAELFSKVVTYSDAATVTLRDNNGSGTVVRNVADGAAANDAANYGQLTTAEIRIMAAVHTLIETGACSYSGGKLQCGGASATGQNSVASGTNALSSGLASVASGTNARATGTNSVAVGAGSVATGTNSVAVGAGSVATGTNSVAVGAGSVATRDNTVSIGNAGAARILTGVGRGVLPNDAVNVEQFREGLSQTLSSATRYAAQATASALAIPQAHIQSGHSNAIAVSVGHYDGYGAIGVSYSHRVDNHASVQLGVGSGGSNIAGRAGFNVSW